jgi:hypothetical protein
MRSSLEVAEVAEVRSTGRALAVVEPADWFTEPVERL